MKLTLVLFLGFISVQSFSQSPWVKEKGKGYAQISYNVITDYRFLYLSTGDSFTLPRTMSDKSIQVYGEYGIGNNWGLSAALPYKLLEAGKIFPQFTGTVLINEGTYGALGNIEIAIKKNFINRGFLFSGELRTELPTSSFDNTTGLRTGLDALSIVPSVSIGKGWDSMYGYINIGSSIRSNDYSGDIKISGELGVQPIDKLWVIVVLNVVSSFENGNPEIDSNQIQSGFYLNNQEFFAYGLKFAYEIKNGWGINLAGYGGSSGNLVAKAPSMNFGIYYEW